MDIVEERTLLIYDGKYLYFVKKGNKERAHLKLREEAVEIIIPEEKILLLGVVMITVIEYSLDVSCTKFMDSRHEGPTD